jgi:hypothetical protein
MRTIKGDNVLEIQTGDGDAREVQEDPDYCAYGCCAHHRFNCRNHPGQRLSRRLFPVRRCLLSTLNGGAPFGVALTPGKGATVRKTLVLALAVTLAGVAVPASAYYWSKPTDDGLSRTLRGLGFLPNTLPSNLVSVGSLYYVDPQVQFFKTVCHAEESDLEGEVVVSPSAKVVADELYSGRFATGIQVNLDWLLKGNVDKNYQANVHYSLTEVLVHEISLGNNRRVFAKMMAKPECNEEVVELINGGGYVCQAQQVLQATAEYNIELDERSKMAIETNAKTNEIKDVVKLAIETKSDQAVVERSGRLLAGSALNYGVSMNPTCLAPPQARFARVLPKTMFGRIKNFVEFSIIERIWPANEERSAVAQM